jgi:hypothetical protein
MTKGAKPIGAWKPGQSGNPAGRKPGSGAIGKLRTAIAKDVPDIIASLTAAAKSGDVGAARLLLERAIPPIKAAELPTPILLPDGTLADQGRAVMVAAGAGDIAPGQAAQLLNGLGSLAKLIETDELMRRIDALEAKHGIAPAT